MKRLILQILIILLQGFCGLLAQPQLRVPDGDFDFGYVPHSSTVVQQFWFKSVGTDTVKIENIRTGCDCAYIPLEKNWLAPGDSMKVSFFWESKRRMGPMNRKPTIYSNVEGKPLQLNFVGNCHINPDKYYPVSIKPYRFEFSKLEKISIDSIEFILSNQTDSNYTISAVSYPMEECSYVLPEKIAAKAEVKGHIKVNPQFLNREFLQSLTLQFLSESGNVKRVTVPIRRKIFSNEQNQTK